jgi:nucleoid DNA-binding protein
MTKDELIRSVAKTTNNPISKVGEVINQCFNTIKQEVAQNKKVSIHSFGCFALRKRGSRIIKTPRGEEVKTKESTYPKFKPSSAFKAEAADNTTGE